MGIDNELMAYIICVNIIASVISCHLMGAYYTLAVCVKSHFFLRCAVLAKFFGVKAV